MKPTFVCAPLFLFAALIFAQQPDVRQQAAAQYRAAMEAYQQQDYKRYFEHLKIACDLRPTHPGLLFRLAGAHALLGEPRHALRLLQRVIAMRSEVPLRDNPDFAALQNMPEFEAVLRRYDHLQQPIANSTVAFRVPERDLIPEGIAHDPKTGAFFVSSVHKRKIVRVDRDGASTDFATSADGKLWSVFALAVDSERRRLWACTGVTRQMQRIAEEQASPGITCVVRYDLESGREQRRYCIGSPEAPHNLQDLVLAANGDTYVADTEGRAIYRITIAADTLELFVGAGVLISPQGLAFAPGEAHLFVADYSLGLLRFDMATRRHIALSHPDSVTLLGIDGLLYHDGGLVAIQNGTQPHRVLRLGLSDDLAAVNRVEVIDFRHPAFDEPTLGTIAGTVLFYVGNSQWGRFNADSTIFPIDQLAEPAILRFDLGTAADATRKIHDDENF